MALMRNSDYYSAFPSIVSDFLKGDLSDWMNLNFSSTNSTLPAMNVRETEEEFVIEVAAPGMQKSDFKINIARGVLTINSERKEENNFDNGDGGKYSRREFYYQSFQRSFNVPENIVDGDKIKAKYTDGILYVTLPKKEEVKKVISSPKEIAIS